MYVYLLALMQTKLIKIVTHNNLRLKKTLRQNTGDKFFINIQLKICLCDHT